MITCPIDKTRTKIIELGSIDKRYSFGAHNKRDSDFYALKNVSLNVYRGEVLGLIGRNGAGKTTLLNIIAGILKPTAGNVSIDGRIMGLFNLGVGFQDELTGKENIFLNGAILGAAREEIKNKLNVIIEFSELGKFIDMPLGSYSQGMRLRLGFSIIANLDFDILLIDEVLAVGDSLFQSKCYERLMDFRRQERTLIITTQSMEMIERLCDTAALLDHGSLLHIGAPKEAIDKYHTLLNTERFFVGVNPKPTNLIENTKKWADDISEWGKKFGTKDVVIEKVDFINKWGIKTNRIKTREPLKIKVYYNVRNKVKNPHFGVAIFREDGVYCYGPNTEFDGITIPELKEGIGSFTLKFRSLLLAPGDYRVSVAIWDKNEILAYDYNSGFYNLNIIGMEGKNSQLLDIPYRISNFGKSIDITIKLYDDSNKEGNLFITNCSLRILVSTNWHNGLYILRDDGIYCQEILLPRSDNRFFSIYFPRLPLLPGCYNIYMDEHNICSFNMIFNKQDHGTVYLEHKWRSVLL